ncbi:MAG: transposase [Actinobacteria bacterium]|nr:transposase [Actinomycetota bacterium]
MPRDARNSSSTGIYHIMLRGINRQDIFGDEEDIERLLETIKKYKEVSQYQIYAYCVMSNHIHMLIKETEDSISNIIKRISSSYVFWYNKRYERCGHLFQERFKSEAVENDEYFLTVVRYIHQNPIKAGVVKGISDYKWSSYNEYMDRAVIVDSDFVLDMLSPDRKSAIELFRSFNIQKNNDACLEIDEKVRVSDSKLRECLLNLGIVNPREMRQLDKSKRDDIIKKLKSINGITIRQLSRMTGISKSVLDRV